MVFARAIPLCAKFRCHKELLFAANAGAPEIAPRPSNFPDGVFCARSFQWLSLGSKTSGRIRRRMGKREVLENSAQSAAANCDRKTKSKAKQKVADEPVSRILCHTQTAKRLACAAIIPLGHGSDRDSSSLPEGFHPRWLAPP